MPVNPPIRRQKVELFNVCRVVEELSTCVDGTRCTSCWHCGQAIDWQRAWAGRYLPRPVLQSTQSQVSRESNHIRKEVTTDPAYQYWFVWSPVKNGKRASTCKILVEARLHLAGEVFDKDLRFLKRSGKA